METFIELIESYKHSNRFNDCEVSKKLNISTMTLNRWRRGESHPRKDQMVRIELFINSQNIFIDPIDILSQEIVNLQKKFDELKEMINNFKIKK